MKSLQKTEKVKRMNMMDVPNLVRENNISKMSEFMVAAKKMQEEGDEILLAFMKHQMR